MKIERFISLFDTQTDALIKEVNVSYISINILLRIFGSHKDDPLLYRVYSINKEKLKALNDHLKEPIQIDTEKITYILDCFQVE
jgi:hypothetical protein